MSSLIFHEKYKNKKKSKKKKKINITAAALVMRILRVEPIVV